MKMNFKIEMNYLNIDNYPSIEKHFEEMANKGWLIDKVIIGSMFIYKKVEPQGLDFSISPYEVETPLTRKSKEDLKEFQTVSESVGWKYVDKSYDLHIYYKAKGEKAIPMHTDVEEEFRILEKIAKRYLTVQYITLPLLIILSWFLIRNLFINISPMKDGLTQIISLAVPFALMVSIKHVYDLRKFLKTNRERMKQGKKLAFHSSNQWLYKFVYSVFYFIFIGLFIYILYSMFVLDNLQPLMSLLPTAVGVGIGLLFRAWVKPSRKGTGFKLGSLVLTLIIAGIIGILLGWARFSILNQSEETPNLDSYQVLTGVEFFEEEPEEWGDLTRNASLLVPTSYDYTEYFEDGVLQTEYAKTLTEGLAEDLVERYVVRQGNRLQNRYGESLDASFAEEEYQMELESSGLTEEDFNQIYAPDEPIEIGEIWDRMEERSITDASSVWNVEEAYFLSYDNSEMVLREGREVYYLSGLDFSNPEIIESAKTELQME